MLARCSCDNKSWFVCVAVQAGSKGPISPFSQCQNANISVCAASSSLPFVFVAYNPLPRRSMEVVKVPVPVSSAGLVVQDEHGNAVPFDTVPSPGYDVGVCRVGTVVIAMLIPCVCGGGVRVCCRCPCSERRPPVHTRGDGNHPRVGIHVILRVRCRGCNVCRRPYKHPRCWGGAYFHRKRVHSPEL